MVDLTRYKSNIIAASEKSYNVPSNEHGSLFEDYMFLRGYKIGRLEYGALVRIADPTDIGQKKSGWYIYHQNETISVAVYGSWKDDKKQEPWYSKERHNMTFDERIEVDNQIKQAQEKQRIERDKVQQEAADDAFKLISELPNATSDNPYIKRKQVRVFKDVKAKGDNLIIPVTLNGAITSIQTIMPDGTKRFKTGGRTKGCYFALEGDESIVYIAEGYATAASIAEATGNAVYISFSAHNLFETWSAIKDNYGKVVICGDNDKTCVAKCQQIQCESIFPPVEHNDFNDWWVAAKEEMIAFFNKKPETKKEEKVTASHGFKPTGVITQIVDYYNATARREQPLFAIQCAIATCSVILARNFETNYENRTSLFLMNVAKSATGKEHAKKICEKILIATDNRKLIVGSGYTSSSGVVSACYEKPRHITIIDEFTKYLQACQNKNSGGHMAEANSTLMQVITSLEGELRPKNMAKSGLNLAQKKEMQDYYIINPAITMLSMTTPESLYKTMSVDAIKDGFLNRFIICISDMPRELPHNREPMPVPESIIDWEKRIGIRRGSIDESPIISPNIIVIPFSEGCKPILRDYNIYCLNVMNSLDKFELSEMAGRTAEMAQRLALILALSDNPDTAQIEEKHLEQAIKWVKFNFDRIIKELKINISASDHEASKKEILKALREKGGLSKSDMFKRPPFSKYARKNLDDLLSELEEAELIIKEIEQREGAGNRKTIWKAI